MRLINADAVLAALSIFHDDTGNYSHFMNGIKTAREIIEDAPTGVVTCLDCKYFAIKDYWGDFNGHPILATSDAPTCTKWGTGDCLTRPNGFCFLAERREADDETD